MFKTLLSISEAKISALIIGLLLALGFGLYIAYVRGDIPNNLTTIITTFILTIGGVNAIHGATSLMSGKGAQTPTVTGSASVSAAEEPSGKKGVKATPTADHTDEIGWTGLEADDPAVPDRPTPQDSPTVSTPAVAASSLAPSSTASSNSSTSSAQVPGAIPMSFKK